MKKTILTISLCLTFFSVAYAQTGWPGGYAAGASEVFLTGNLKNHFSPRTLFGISLDCYPGNIMMALKVTAGSLKLKTPLSSQTTGYDYDFQGNERFAYYDLGFLAGYTFKTRGQRLRFSPFACLGSMGLQSQLFDYKDDRQEFDIFDAFYFGPGFRADVDVIRLKKDEDGYIGLCLRFEAGYNIPVKYKYSPAKGNIPYAQLALVIAFLDWK
jgi:hypothetical protein